MCLAQVPQRSADGEAWTPSYCNFPESRKKNLISKIIFFILSDDSKYYLFHWKIIIYFWGYVCVFLRVTLLKMIVLNISWFLGKWWNI